MGPSGTSRRSSRSTSAPADSNQGDHDHDHPGALPRLPRPDGVARLAPHQRSAACARNRAYDAGYVAGLGCAPGGEPDKHAAEWRRGYQDARRVRMAASKAVREKHAALQNPGYARAVRRDMAAWLEGALAARRA
jgi:hypothetical protein